MKEQESANYMPSAVREAVVYRDLIIILSIVDTTKPRSHTVFE